MHETVQIISNENSREMRLLTLDELDAVSGGEVSASFGFWGVKETITFNGPTTCTTLTTPSSSTWQCTTKVM